MSGTNKQPIAQRGGRRPANLVDSQLEHLESMVQHLTRGDAVSVLVPLDHEYWEKRIRVLEETHELIASQRQRVIKLLDQLGSEAQMKPTRRTAA
jgi:exonuclease VII small subunit